MKTTKTSYDVDLTVEPLHTLAAVGGKLPDAAPKFPAQVPSSLKHGKAEKDAGQQQQASSSKLVAADKRSSKEGGESPKRKKNAKKGKKGKGRPSSCSESNSSTSSDSSASEDDEDFRSTRGMRHALEAWRYPFYTPSASYRQLDALAGSHQYTVSGYSLARAMGCGARLCSDFFEVAGQVFRLEVYPAGFTADTRKYVSVFLTTPGTLNPNHIMFDISILDQSGKDKHITARSGHGGRHMQGPLVAHTRGVVGAVLRLAKCKHLEDKHKRYLPHDMLVLRATVYVLRGWSSLPTVHPHSATMLMTSPTLAPAAAANLSAQAANASWYNPVMPGSGLGMAGTNPMASVPAGMPSMMHPTQPLAMPSQRVGVTYAASAYQQPQMAPLVQLSQLQQPHYPTGAMMPPVPMPAPLTLATAQPVPTARFVAAPMSQGLPCFYGAPCMTAMPLA